MGYPLTDITIYANGYFANDKTASDNFHRKANYISDLFHLYLNGYKPAITARICSHLTKTLQGLHKPRYFGSILECYVLFVGEDYSSGKEEDQNLYNLNILHNKVIGLSCNFSWIESVFITVYSKCIENGLKLIKEYPSMKSKDKKVTATVVVEKKEQTTYTFFKTDNE